MAEHKRTPWWFHLMVGLIGLTAALTYVQAGITDPTGDPRNWILAAVWSVLGGLWILFALINRRRSG